MIFFISSLRSCQNKTRQEQLLQQEIRQRMEIEEKVLVLSERNRNLQDSVDKQKADCRAIQEELNRQIRELESKLDTVSRTYFRRSE